MMVMVVGNGGDGGGDGGWWLVVVVVVVVEVRDLAEALEGRALKNRHPDRNVLRLDCHAIRGSSRTGGRGDDSSSTRWARARTRSLARFASTEKSRVSTHHRPATRWTAPPRPTHAHTGLGHDRRRQKRGATHDQLCGRRHLRVRYASPVLRWLLGSSRPCATTL